LKNSENVIKSPLQCHYRCG